MSWVRLDDSFFRNKKSIAAGPEGQLLYLAGLCFCAASMTDGLISHRALPLVVADAGVKRTVADVLVRVDLWMRATAGDVFDTKYGTMTIEADGFYVPDFLFYNPSAVKVKGKREDARQRMRSTRGSGEDEPATTVAFPSTLIPAAVATDDDPRLRDVWATVARAKLQEQRQGGRRIASEAHWLATVCENECSAHVERARQLVDEYPELDTSRLAAVLLGQTTLLRHLRRRSVGDA